MNPMCEFGVVCLRAFSEREICTKTHTHTLSQTPWKNRINLYQSKESIGQKENTEKRIKIYIEKENPFFAFKDVKQTSGWG